MFPKSQKRTDQLVERLRAWLKRAPRGTATQLAKELGVGRNRIDKWLRGDTKPGLEHGLQLLEILRRKPPAKRRDRAP